MPQVVTLDAPELHAVLAGLRSWQALLENADPTSRMFDLMNIATTCDSTGALSATALDALCERLNSAPTLSDVGDVPQVCPFCGSVGTLTSTAGAGFIEKGCWNGKAYCYEGDLPGYVCNRCNHDFTLDVDEDTIHAECDCEENPDCECGRYEEAHA
jgi:hypothetical protein